MGNYKIFLSLVFALFVGITAQAESFYYLEDFDNSQTFSENEDVPNGWKSIGTYAFHRMIASHAGYTAQSGDYVFGTTGSSSYGRDETFCTQGFELKGGVACKVRFYYLAPGGTPSSVRNTTLHIAAGNSRDYTAMTELGKTAAPVTSWKQYEFSFTPETDGTYYFGFKIEAQLAMSGYALIDDLEIEGEKPTASPIVGKEISTLESFYSDEITSTDFYKYIGESVVTYVNDNLIFVQDETAAIRILLNNGENTYKIGDKITSFEGTVSTDSYGVLTLQVEKENSGELLSSDNVVASTTVTLSDLLASPKKYVSRLVRINSLDFSNTEDGDVFEEDIAYMITDGENETLLTLFSNTDLSYTAIPTTSFDLTALVVLNQQLTLMPRSTADIEEAQIPVEHETESLPYLQSFDNTDNDYDGTSYLPRGWVSTGTAPFVTAASSDLAAATGTYYMITDESDAVRDEIAYTPFFDLTAGTTYSISFMLSMPGNTESAVNRTTDMMVSVGKDQTREAQDTELLTIMQTESGWTKQEISFTPSVDGQYCFAFSLSSDYGYAGIVAIDDVLITAPGLILRPTADFTYEGWFNIMNSNMLSFTNTPVQMYNTSKYGTSFEWEIIGAVPEKSTEENPQFLFPEEGEYEVKMTASNATGSRTTYKTISVEKFTGKADKMGLKTYNGSEKVASSYSDVPTYETDETYDFISGFNHYYRRYAERFEFPETIKFTLSSISTWLVSYQRMLTYTAEERNFPFTIALYGETNGLPDESKCFGKKVSTVVDEFGSQGIGLENAQQWGFSLGEDAITVKGAFYIAFEFSDDMPIESNDANIERSFLALSTVKHNSGETTLYAKPTAGPNNFSPNGNWYRADQISTIAQGYGLNLILWGSLDDGTNSGIVAVGADGQIVFDTFLKEDNLHISGTTANETISVFDLAGHIVLTSKAHANTSCVAIDSLPQGTYVVKCNAGTRKFVIVH